MIGKSGQTTDATLLADFQYNLGQRYQTCFAILASYINQDTKPDTTVIDKQYYNYPVGTQSVDDVTITIGDRVVPLTTIYDTHTWSMINSLPFQPTGEPQFIFPRRDDYGIWPIPSGVYDINFSRFFRDRNLLVADYTTGTVTMTNGSKVVTGTDTIFTAAMVGRWLSVTNTATPGQGYFYRIGSYTSPTEIGLERTWSAATTSTAVVYKICETPELPEELHASLPFGTVADYYSGLRNDVENSKRFDNMFWTGSMSQISRKLDDKNITGGLIGTYQRYKDRDRDVLVHRGPVIHSPSSKIFSYSITE